MTGETNLDALIRSMKPKLIDGVFVYVTTQETELDLTELKPLATILEQEGLTLVLDKAVAQRKKFDYLGDYRLISLQVHSSLEAVGLTAAFATALGNANISANVLAGYYHDHLLVQEVDAERAMSVLTLLSQQGVS